MESATAPTFDDQECMPPPSASAESLVETSITEHVALKEKHQQLNPTSNELQRFLLHPLDRSVVLDAQGRPLTLDRFLSTKPLQSELCTRPGPGNKRLTYLAGDAVTRLLNETFGFDGWNYEVRKLEKVDISTPQPTKFHVTYMAHVRITIKGGVFREDVGFGDSIDKQKSTAVAHAVKSAVTDALKRAARHFGERLGNSLYDGQFSIKNAPTTLAQALEQYDQRLKERYSWLNNKKTSSQSNVVAQPQQSHSGQQSSPYAQQQPPQSPVVSSLPALTSHVPFSGQHQPHPSRPPLSTVSTNQPARHTSVNGSSTASYKLTANNYRVCPPSTTTATASTMQPVAPTANTSASNNRQPANQCCATPSTTIASLDLAQPHHHGLVTSVPLISAKPPSFATPLAGSGPSLMSTTLPLHAASVPPAATPGSVSPWQQHQPHFRPTTASGRNATPSVNNNSHHAHQAVVTQNTPLSSLPAKRPLEQLECNSSSATSTTVFIKKANPYQQQQVTTSLSTS